MSGLAWVTLNLALIAAALLAARAYVRWSNRELDRLREREYWWDEFASASRPLLEDVDTPPVILEALQHFTFAIREPEVLRLLYLRMKEPHRPRNDRVVATKAFQKARPELGDALDRAIVAGFLATTYQSEPLGSKVRAIAMDRSHRGKDETSFYAQEIWCLSLEPRVAA